MNCPKCGWPGLIGGTIKKRLAQLEENDRIRFEDNRFLREQVAGAKALLRRAQRPDLGNLSRENLVHAALELLG